MARAPPVEPEAKASTGVVVSVFTSALCVASSIRSWLRRSCVNAAKMPSKKRVACAEKCVAA